MDEHVAVSKNGYIQIHKLTMVKPSNLAVLCFSTLGQNVHIRDLALQAFQHCGN
jgi:hypothetical protein